jgi:hypothetical protein
MRLQLRWCCWKPEGRSTGLKFESGEKLEFESGLIPRWNKESEGNKGETRLLAVEWNVGCGGMDSGLQV